MSSMNTERTEHSEAMCSLAQATAWIDGSVRDDAARALYPRPYRQPHRGARRLFVARSGRAFRCARFPAEVVARGVAAVLVARSPA